MSAFEPGPGWRELADDEVPNPWLREIVAWYADGQNIKRRWVSEVPVPPLPTVPYTVIRVTWHQADVPYELILRDEDRGWYFVGTEDHLQPETLAAKITGFEIVSEPRAVTAKAVLDFVDLTDGLSGGTYRAAAAEFGVDQ